MTLKNLAKRQFLVLPSCHLHHHVQENLLVMAKSVLGSPRQTEIVSVTGSPVTRTSDGREIETPIGPETRRALPMAVGEGVRMVKAGQVSKVARV